jgi:hypothetical protein
MASSVRNALNAIRASLSKGRQTLAQSSSDPKATETKPQLQNETDPLPIYRIGISSFTLETIVVDGSRLGVM